MYFKDKRYYINRLKECASILLSAALFDVAVLFIIFVL